MHKPAVTDVALHDLIRNRWSPRAFAERPVPPEVLRSLFEAARWAPSSNNEQPWAYLVATKDDVENFVEANARGLQVHQMAGFDAEKARQTFAIPDDWEPVAAIAVGYPGNPESLPEKLRERELAPRTRKPLGEFVMAGGWGHTAPFVAT